MDKIIFFKRKLQYRKNSNVLPSTPDISKLIIKGSDSKYFKLQDTDGLSHNNSTLPLYHKVAIDNM